MSFCARIWSNSRVKPSPSVILGQWVESETRLENQKGERSVKIITFRISKQALNKSEGTHVESTGIYDFEGARKVHRRTRCLYV